MKITLYFSTNAREQEIGRAIVAGCAKHKVRVDSRLRSDFWTGDIDPTADVIGFVGVKSRKMWQATLAANKVPLIIDKGYFGRGDFYRISLGGYQPPYLSRMNYTPDRLNSMGVLLRPRVDPPGDSVMYVGSSEKYCLFHDLGSCNDYAQQLLINIRKHWPGPLIYRPKPSWFAKHKRGERRDRFTEAPINAIFSGPEGAKGDTFAPLLKKCRAVVTHGSNGAVEALAFGVPAIVLSELSPIYDLCSHDTCELGNPRWPSDKARLARLSNLAWCQYTVKEIAGGFAWDVIKKYT